MTKQTFIVTGPTSGYGLATARRLAAHGRVVLVGRDPEKLDRVRGELGNGAMSVVAELADLVSVRRAAAEIAGLDLAVSALVANAGVQGPSTPTNAQGWDLTFATNHLGTICLVEALAPQLPDGANVVVVGSAVEDPERRQAKAAGFRGGRFVSVEASVRGEWLAGGSKVPGFDAYATSKQCVLAATLALARESSRLRFKAIEPGFNATTGLSRGASPTLRTIANLMFPLLRPLLPGATTPERAGRVIADIALDRSATGVYYDEAGQPMRASTLASDPAFQDRVLAETRAFLAKH